ncbi:hypothetical protein NGRA_2709 [Nosema granulosis]|uniref:Integrase catalytic domain-containing protein n=1 Tax=Nosema granulosis TaxID=83296 RepID=A0A9P6KY66_9MICR|nr:hypothetical protein NGRA_2709 [Nosema granulosis]
MKDQVTKRLRECERCQIGNRKAKGGVEFVTTSSKGEKLAIDVMEIGEPRIHVLVGIDYYKRFLYAKVLEDKTAQSITKAMEVWFKNEKVPEMIISDNAKEFEGVELMKWCI